MELGEAEQASQVRAEVAQLTAKPEVQQQPTQEVVTPLGVPRVASVTVKLPAVSAPAREPKLTEAPKVAEVSIAPPRQSTVTVNLPAARPISASRFATIAAVDVPPLAPRPVANPASPPTVPVAPVQPAVLVRQATVPEIGKPQFSAAPVHLAQIGRASCRERV